MLQVSRKADSQHPLKSQTLRHWLKRLPLGHQKKHEPREIALFRRLLGLGHCRCSGTRLAILLQAS